MLLAADAPQRRLLRPTPRLLAASCASQFVGNFLCVRLAGPLKNLHCVTATIYPNDYFLEFLHDISLCIHTSATLPTMNHHAAFSIAVPGGTSGFAFWMRAWRNFFFPTFFTFHARFFLSPRVNAHRLQRRLVNECAEGVADPFGDFTQNAPGMVEHTVCEVSRAPPVDELAERVNVVVKPHARKCGERPNKGSHPFRTLRQIHRARLYIR